MDQPSKKIPEKWGRVLLILLLLAIVTASDPPDNPP